ncbi:YqcI/YcgG family protein [Bacillus suaedae]|uniref:YqcI/YcgG family protein n=1 Tax=Halalkalibacter suaedae TaxID=2822140 RepID=A0A940WUT6_9BACI|nr:YqcI/YcgG family protein [Bacillus suaedae]MBP3952835.1 YqcI/YcgG family protein [Bacillus suaedae]
MLLFNNEAIEEYQLAPWKRDAIKQFNRKMTDKDNPFPCIPATQGYALKHFKYGFVADPRTDHSIDELAALLTEYTKHSKNYGKYTSLVVFYDTSDNLANQDVIQLEQLFWKQLNGLTERDQCLWPEDVPADPHDSLWEFCFHDERYFMFCATPAHSNRQSRSFPYFMLGITPRWVLDKFHSSPMLANKIKSEIRHRLENYDSIPTHPDLNSYGKKDNYEWKQYFLHDDKSSLSQCPFHSLWSKEKDK